MVRLSQFPLHLRNFRSDLAVRLQAGEHRAFEAKNNTPFANLFVTMLQRMNIETDHFGSSTGTVTV